MLYFSTNSHNIIITLGYFRTGGITCTIWMKKTNWGRVNCSRFPKYRDISALFIDLTSCTTTNIHIIRNTVTRNAGLRPLRNANTHTHHIDTIASFHLWGQIVLSLFLLTTQRKFNKFWEMNCRPKTIITMLHGLWIEC